MMNHTDSVLVRPKEATGIWIERKQVRKLENELDAHCLVDVDFAAFSSCKRGLRI